MKSALILLASMATLALAEPEARPSGLKVEYISVPETCEQKAMNGAMLSMHYTGKFFTISPNFDKKNIIKKLCTSKSRQIKNWSQKDQARFVEGFSAF